MINIQNTNDNEYLKWSIVRYLNPVHHNRRRIPRTDKKFTKKFDFKSIKFPVKISDIHKFEKKQRIPLELVFLVIKIRKNISFMYQENVLKKNMLIYY